MNFIFDTNAYRNLVHGKSLVEVKTLAEKLKEQEKKGGYSSSGSVVVMMELIQHLEDGDPAQEDCYKALCMLFWHTMEVDTTTGNLRGSLCPPMNIILANIFFGKDSKYVAIYNIIADLFLRLVTPTDIKRCNEFKDQIRAIKSQILHEKSEFRNNVENLLASLNDGVVNWKYFTDNKAERKEFLQKFANGDMVKLVGVGLLERAHQVMDLRELSEDAILKLESFINDYQAPILMNLNILKSVANGAEKLKDASDARWNTLNDVQILFGAWYSQPGKSENILVTEEKKIKESAQEAGKEDKVKTISEYFELIGYKP